MSGCSVPVEAARHQERGVPWTQRSPGHSGPRHPSWSKSAAPRLPSLSNGGRCTPRWHRSCPALCHLWTPSITERPSGSPTLAVKWPKSSGTERVDPSLRIRGGIPWKLPGHLGCSWAPPAPGPSRWVSKERLLQPQTSASRPLRGRLASTRPGDVGDTPPALPCALGTAPGRRQREPPVLLDLAKRL